MNHKRIESEIKYVFASLLLNQILEDVITKDEWILFKKKIGKTPSKKICCSISLCFYRTR